MSRLCTGLPCPRLPHVSSDTPVCLLRPSTTTRPHGDTRWHTCHFLSPTCCSHGQGWFYVYQVLTPVCTWCNHMTVMAHLLHTCCIPTLASGGMGMYAYTHAMPQPHNVETQTSTPVCILAVFQNHHMWPGCAHGFTCHDPELPHDRAHLFIYVPCPSTVPRW